VQVYRSATVASSASLGTRGALKIVSKCAHWPVSRGGVRNCKTSIPGSNPGGASNQFNKLPPSIIGTPFDVNRDVNRACYHLLTSTDSRACVSLNLTIINQHGMWQCSDHRLVNTSSGRVEDDDSVKQVTLRCQDGTAVIAYAGIGKLNRVHISDWIRETLRGEGRTVDQSLIFLRENASRDLGPFLRGRLHHMFTVGAIIQGQTWLAQIRNFHPTPDKLWAEPLATFETAGVRVTAGVVTAFPPLLSPADSQLLMRVAARRPRKPEEFSELLAAINRRVAAGPARRVVSSHCVTTYVPPAGEPSNVKFHDTTRVSRNLVVPMLLFGIDTTEMMKGLMTHMADPSSALDTGGQAAVTPVNRLRGLLSGIQPKP